MFVLVDRPTRLNVKPVNVHCKDRNIFLYCKTFQGKFPYLFLKAPLHQLRTPAYELREGFALEHIVSQER